MRYLLLILMLVPACAPYQVFRTPPLPNDNIDPIASTMTATQDEGLHISVECRQEAMIQMILRKQDGFTYVYSTHEGDEADYHFPQRMIVEDAPFTAQITIKRARIDGLVMINCFRVLVNFDGSVTPSPDQSPMHYYERAAGL